MREEIRIRPLRTEGEMKQMVDWMERNSRKNGVEPDIFLYPDAQVFVAENGKPLSYMPIHSAMILESIAPDPNATDLVKARCLVEFVKAMAFLKSTHGAGEMYFIGTDEDVNKLAENHGFEKVEMPVYRLKVR